MNNLIPKYITLAWSIAALMSCNRQHATNQLSADKNAEIHYAELLSIEDVEEDITIVSISDPWRTERVMMQYLLVPKSNQNWVENKEQVYCKDKDNITVIRTPLTQNAITSSCHAYLLSLFDALDNLAVLCDTSYIKAQVVKDWMREKAAIPDSPSMDGGISNAPNIERILSAQCDALWVSPYDNSSLSNYSQMPFALIYCADYMETSPLGRAEWMKFYGRLVGKSQQADSLFNVIADRYEELKQTKRNDQKLLAELPYGATWYVPGGASTSGILYEDAGFDYLWHDDNHAGSLSLSKEAVLVKALDSDIWLLKYNNPTYWTLDDLLSQDPQYRNIKAVKNHNVWACNTEYSDYFDVVPFRPDTLLSSLQKMDGLFFKQLQ